MADPTQNLIELVSKAGDLGLSEPSIAQSLPPASDVPEMCRRLMANGEIVRRGEGTQEQPYTYHLPDGGVPRL